ncbi:YigZ family protein [Helicobacter turcicus]|uniref:YigZ family protein n=1 Tax=Helicobacter turcicus TaxID=2867412 RepID=A0ABS7JKL1_9HELI|nr:YigZ family protein [Helicobacter turcicus]MBX7489929.1 YigZ family protein [Helicobacter turcicus]MBX7544789.1 YigZ family protein [Helicobacter turcicus]
MEDLYYPLEIVESSFEVKGSTFISYAIPKVEVENWNLKMRQKHPKAVHFVMASRSFNDKRQIKESFSDDGEPKGTSGMPTLKVLRGYGLIECGLLTIRYFGGTLLGTGGLVRAYTQAAKDVVLKARNSNKLALYIPKECAEIMVSFTLFTQVEYLAKKFGIQIIKREFLSNGVCLKVEAKAEVLAQFLKKVETLQY